MSSGCGCWMKSMRKLTTRAARAMARKRTRFGAGIGRPRKDAPRCACGLYTAQTAEKRYHVCVRAAKAAPALKSAKRKRGRAGSAPHVL